MLRAPTAAVALRPVCLPLEYAQALRQLHDHVAPFPGAELRRVVEREVDGPIDSVFADFEEDPFAAGRLRVGAEAMVEQRFCLGLLHADPRPGNVLSPPGDCACFLDFGIFGRLRLRARRPRESL